MVLIPGRHKASLGTTTLQGPTSLETITTINEITTCRFYVDNGEVFSESDADDIGECSVCNKPGILFECSTATNCKRWFHLECTPLLFIPEDDWTCANCTVNKPRHIIPPTLMGDLRDRQLDGENFITSSDGSYRENINSSTYGFAIMTYDKHLSYATGRKIEVQSMEVSSLRVELEGLITAYELLP
jgi:hypothetical protein